MNNKILVPQNKCQAGQTFIEVLIALGVAVTIIVALVTTTISSMRSAQFAKLQAQATKLSQEALEKTRAQRDQNGWTAFNAAYTNGSIWCLRKDENGGWINNTCESLAYKIDDIFSRNVSFEDGTNRKTVTVVTTWTDANGTHESRLATYLTKWQ